MSRNDLESLAAVVRLERTNILAEWRARVRLLPSARTLDTPTLNDHVPTLLDELADALEDEAAGVRPESQRKGSPPAHGLQRLEDGFDIAEIVGEYSIMRGVIHDLAERMAVRLQGAPFVVLNRLIDSSIALAVQTFATQQALEVQRRRQEHLAFIAHDLRTPLNAVSLAAGMLEISIPQHDDSEITNRMLKTLHRSVQTLVGLVGAVVDEHADLDTDGELKLERRELDLWPLVESLLRDLQPVASSAKTRLTNRVPDELTMYADAARLRRILQNLVSNSIHYTPGGEVVVGAEREGADGTAACWVIDNGAGIPPALLAHVFDKGASDPEDDARTGLGLAIVKRFVEAHGGTVTVHSTVDEGTKFRCTFPGRQLGQANAASAGQP